MKPDSLGRLALSSIFAVLGFIALIRRCGVFPTLIVWWLFYCIGCGVVLNTEKGEQISALAIMALLPAAIPIAMAGFFVAVDRPLCLSMPGSATLLLLPVASWFSIFVFSFARGPL